MEQIWLKICFVACALCMTAHVFADGDSKLTNAPPYIKMKDGKPFMQFGVVNQSTKVKSHLLNHTLEVVRKQVQKHFSPYYGIHADFTVFDTVDGVDWSKFVPLMIVNTLLIDLSGAISFHDFQQPAPSFNGDPIEIWITNPPDLPNGTPYIIIPIGTKKTDYGVLPAYLSGNPTLPPTFATLFSWAVSHEVLETLVDYDVNQYTLTQIASNTVRIFINEVCDPVEFTPGYVLDGLNVSDFVLPSFWLYNLETGPYSFLNTVPAPLTPFAGELSVAEFGCCEAENLLLYSNPPQYGNPNIVYTIDLGPIFSCLSCANTNQSSTDTQATPSSRLRVHRVASTAQPLKKAS